MSELAPRRFERPSALTLALLVGTAAFLIASLQGIGFTASGFFAGLPNMGRILAEMFPPSGERLVPVAKALLETFQMALVGTVAGVFVSLPLAVLATRHLSPHVTVYHAARGLIALFRTVPDLVWALFFVVAIGLGPFAGTLAIMVDIMGFCGRFFAEAMEEADRGPQEALRALGAGRAAVIAAAVIPAAMPSFVNTSLFSLEKANRSSVVLGLVGAGGIGIELQVSMDLFRYAEASAIIIAIFVLVLAVEQCSAWLRRRLI
jgi:phosphonate transport system permease protein